MSDFARSLVEQITALARRIRNLELSTYIYADQPTDPVNEVAVTGLTGTVTYYTEPVSLLPKAVVNWGWSKPNNPDDPVVDYFVSVTRSTDALSLIHI